MVAADEEDGGGGRRICFYSIQRYRCSELQDVCEHTERRQRELIRELHMYIPGSHPPLPPQPLLSPPKPFASTSLTLDEEKLSEFLCVLACSVTLIGRSVLAISSARK